MLNALKIRARQALKVAFAFTPWLLSMYVLYWLEYGDFWTSETAYRGMIAVAILAVGTGLSLLIQSHFARRV